MPGQRGLQGRFIGWGAVAVLATYALFVGGAWVETYSAFFRALTLVLAAIGITVWIIIAIRDPFWRPRTALGPAFLVALAAFLLCTLTSRYPRFGFEYLAWSIVLVALYLILQRLMASPFFRDRLISFATFAGIVIGVWYVYAVVARWVSWWDLIGGIAAPPLRPGFESLMLGNPSAVMTASVLLAVPAVAWHWGMSRARSGLAVSVIVLALFATIASGSRAGWVAIALAVALVGAFWLAAPARRAGIRALLASRAAKVAAIPAVVGLAVIAVIVGPGLLFRAATGGESVRIGFYLASFRMFESSPLVGTGPGTWAPLRISNTLGGETDYYIPHAHNIYLQTLAEFGLVGIAAGVIVALFLGRLLLGAIRDEDPMTRRMGWASVFGTVYFGAHQLLDFYANAPAILFAYAIPIAYLDAASRSNDWVWPGKEAVRRFSDRMGRPLASGGLAVVTVAVGYLGWSENAASRMNDGTILLNDRDLPGAVAPLEAAAAMDPAMPPYRFALGLALANTGDNARAKSEFLAAASMDDLPEAWINLAGLRASRGDHPGAAEALGRAMRLGDQQPAVAVAAGTIALDLGDQTGAVAAFARAIQLLPSLSGDPWWKADSARAEAWAEAYATAFAQAPPSTQVELALETGDRGAAATALDSIQDAAERETMRLVRAAWEGERRALDGLAVRARERPFDTFLVNWCARLYRRAGDDAAADVYAAWAETLNALSSIGSLEARVVSHDDDFRVAGVNSLFYGHFTYRRPTPSNQFIRALPVLGYQ